MKKVIAMIIEDRKDATMEVKACSKESVSIFITAHNTQTALTQLEIAEEQAVEACKNYVPEEEEPKEEKPQKHYKVSRIATEDIEEGLQEYKDDTKGRKMVKSIMAAGEFRHKKGDTGLRISEFDFIYLLANKDIWEGLLTMYSVGFRRGFNNAQRKCKGK